MFPLTRKFVATGRNKGFVLSIFSQDGKAASNGSNIWEIGTKLFPLARKSVSTSQNEVFYEK